MFRQRKERLVVNFGVRLDKVATNTVVVEMQHDRMELDTTSFEMRLGLDVARTTKTQCFVQSFISLGLGAKGFLLNSRRKHSPKNGLGFFSVAMPGLVRIFLLLQNPIAIDKSNDDDNALLYLRFSRLGGEAISDSS